MKTLTKIYKDLYDSSVIYDNDKDFNNCDKGTTHSYIPIYEVLFDSYRERNITLMELGVQGGISLMVWDEFFHNANKIIGADIDLSRVQKKVLEKQIQLLCCDATNASVLLEEKYDIVIDDASHRVIDQITSFNFILPNINEGGIYIIEDIQNYDEAMYLKNNIHNSEIIDLRCVNGRYDDLLLIFRKGKTS